MISRPAAPDSPEDRDTMRRDFERGVYEREKVESETPETDALIESYMSLSKLTMEFAEHARSLERRLSLAQTEIKGHMRVQDELKARIKKLEWDHYHAWAPMFSRLMMVCHRLENGLPIKLEEVQGWGNEHPAPQAQACIAELEKDAARYRWLCDHDGTEVYCDWVSRKLNDQLGRDALDAAIDAALKSRA